MVLKRLSGSGGRVCGCYMYSYSLTHTLLCRSWYICTVAWETACSIHQKKLINEKFCALLNLWPFWVTARTQNGSTWQHVGRSDIIYLVFRRIFRINLSLRTPFIGSRFLHYLYEIQISTQGNLSKRAPTPVRYEEPIFRTLVQKSTTV